MLLPCRLQDSTVNAGRNLIRGPTHNVFDFAIHRDFALTERAGLEFRWEVFNLSNTVQFGNAGFGSQVAAPSLQSLQLAADPRIMQFALRLLFLISQPLFAGDRAGLIILSHVNQNPACPLPLGGVRRRPNEGFG